MSMFTLGKSSIEVRSNDEGIGSFDMQVSYPKHKNQRSGE